MHRIKIALCLGLLLLNSLPNRLGGQEIKKDGLGEYRRAGLSGGNPAHGKTLFESDKVGCTKCHVIQGNERLAGPELRFIGEKYGREQLVESVLEPNATIHPDYGTVVATTTDRKLHTGVLRKRTDLELQLLDSLGKLVRLPVALIDDERRTATSLMPADLHKTLKPEQFADLIAYLESLKQPQDESRLPGMPSEIPSAKRPIALVPLRKDAMRFDHPVWIIAFPGSKSAFLVVEQQTRRLWRFDPADREHPKELFADFSSESTTGEFEGVACVAFHPRFVENRAKRIVSFGVDADGELLLVGYEGTIFRLVLDGSDFSADPQRTARVKLVRGSAQTAARVSIVGSDNKPHAPAGAAIRKTKRDESYFYADDRFDVELPPGRARLNLSGGIETIPQTVTLDADTNSELAVQIQPWIDMAARGWYSGDSHVHLHTGGTIVVTPADALIAARAEGVNYVNLCVSNNVGDDIRDAELITGKPHAASTDRQLLVFGEEMRSTIFGHMQFFGINRLVEPQYTGFDETPNHFDFPANQVMAAEAVRQGGVVTYGHPMLAGQSFPFEKDLAKPTGAARELPIDAVLGVVHAVDLMSYNSDEQSSAELWYRLLNCGLKLSACVGTDALLDRSTEPLGGERVYVKTAGPLTMQSWLDGLKCGRSFVTNGPIPSLVVNGKCLGETCELPAAAIVHAAVTVESYVPFNKIELLVNGKVAAHDEVGADERAGIRVRRFDVDLPIDRSSWIALRVRGPEHPHVFDGPAWAHTSPVYIQVAGQRIASPEDAAYFVEWIEQMLRVVSARNRYARVEDRRQVEALFHRAHEEFRKMTERR